MRLFQPLILFLALIGALNPSLKAEGCKTTYTQEDLADLPLHQILKIWKDHIASQDTIIERSAASFARFCSSLGMTIRPVARQGIECYDIYYGRQWYFVDPVTLNLYLDLNNETFVSSEELMDDPFLLLRAYSSDLKQGYDQLGRFDIIYSSLGEDIPPNAERMFPNEVVTSKDSYNFDLSASFDAEDCLFQIERAPSEAETICWQVASDTQFTHLQFERMQNYESKLQLTPLLDSFFNANQTYFFRFKTRQNSQWSDWSTILSFSVEKPQSVQYYHFEILGNRTYQISWEGKEEPGLEYLVFGSNALDFIPSIYSNKQANVLVNGQAIEEEEISNLVAITTSTQIIIDDSLAYYRIIARQNGHLSTPSPIIYVYDHGLEQYRTVMQLVEVDGTDFISKRLEIPGYSAVTKLSDFVKTRYVTQEVWDYVKPYFMPINHPIKSKLDRMCSEKRFIQSPETFKKAGFKRYNPGRVSHIMASSNPKLQGYFIKAFSDEQKGISDWQKLTHRIIGAKSITKYITENNYKNQFSVPKKWIYPLPANPSPPRTSQYERKNFILVCEDMRILTHEANNAKYKREMTKEILNGLYCIIRDEGLYDSVYNFNVPFCKNGKLSFIDTEKHHGTNPIRYERFLKYFNTEMQAYWRKLMKNGGPVEEGSADNNDLPIAI